MDGVYELYIQFKSFHNIDLFRQGFYCIKSQIINQSTKEYAFPYHIINTNENKIIEYTSDIDNNHFISDSMHIRFANQEEILNNGCLFRIKYDILSTVEIILQLDLLTVEYSTIDIMNDKEKPAKSEFKSVSTIQLLLPISNNKHSFIQAKSITFNQGYFCQLDMILYGYLIDYKLKPIDRQNKAYKSHTEHLQHYIYTKNSIQINENKESNLIIPYSINDILKRGDQYYQYLYGSLLKSYISLINDIKSMIYDKIDLVNQSFELEKNISLPNVLLKEQQDILNEEKEQNEEKEVEQIPKVEQKQPQPQPQKEEEEEEGLEHKKEEEGIEHKKEEEGLEHKKEEEGLEHKKEAFIKVDFKNKKKIYIASLSNLSDTLDTSIINKEKLQETISNCILNDCHQISPQIFNLWYQYVQILPQFITINWSIYHHKYKQLELDHMKSQIYSQHYKIHKLFQIPSIKQRQLHLKMEKIIDIKQQSSDLLLNYPLNKKSNLFFEQTYTTQLSYKQWLKMNPNATITKDQYIELNCDKIRQQYAIGDHIYIFVHGYQANSWDMRLFCNYMRQSLPNMIYLLAQSNENDTDQDINMMGLKLAEEIQHFLYSKGYLKLNNETKAITVTKKLARISFICHSLGGLLVRSALSYDIMKKIHSYLYNYISLAVPHTGYINAENTLLSTGIWMLKTWNKSICLSQMSCSDSIDKKSMCLYQLCTSNQSLSYFQYIFLLACSNDKYAPYHSARIEHIPKEIHHSNNTNTSLNQQMIDHLLSSININKTMIKRIHISFLKLIILLVIY